jgi:hypothetical protein
MKTSDNVTEIETEIVKEHDANSPKIKEHKPKIGRETDNPLSLRERARLRAHSKNKDSPNKKTTKKVDKKKPWIFEKENQLSNPSSVSQALVDHLSKRFPPEYIAEKVAELLVATHVTRGGNPIADNRAREAGVKLLLSYLVGLPVQRQEIVNVNIDSLADLQQRAQQSPALRQAVAKLLGEDQPNHVQSDGGPIST